MSENIRAFKFEVSKKDRNQLNGHNSFVIWFTGLSGSGKSSLANKVEYELFKDGIRTFTLDGDNVREGINRDLGFGEEERGENLRRMAEIAKILMDSGVVVLASFISPLEKDRNFIKKIIGKENIIEIFVNTPIEVCEQRDVKGLYKKAREGQISNFTGINAPYEPPFSPDLEIQTENEMMEKSVLRILGYLQNKLKIIEHE